MRFIEPSQLDTLDLKSDANRDDIVIVKGFCAPQLCTQVVADSHDLMKRMPHRKTVEACHFSYDVLPQQAANARIFRTLNFTDFSSPYLSNAQTEIFRAMCTFQDHQVLREPDWQAHKQTRYMQILHYPRGGGFLDWHDHPRQPVNYGLIVNLSKRGRDFDHGATEIIDQTGATIRVEDHCDIGDLVVFRYDLKHRVAPCDPEHDLCFDTAGRWTAIMPIY